MNVIWIMNIPILEEEIGYTPEKEICEGGWLEGAYIALKNYDINIKLVFPDKKIAIQQAYETVVYRKSATKVSKGLIEQFMQMFESNAPDVIHIWGTELIHCYAAFKAAQRLGLEKRVVVSIQGMVSIYAIHYMAGVPLRYRLGISINELMRCTSLIVQQCKFYKRGRLEQETIRNIKWVIGRTEWDKACLYEINPKIQYMHCNENLRKQFYHAAKWKENACKRYTIFFSQAHYPIKGLHCLFKAMPAVLEMFPDARVIISGERKELYNKLKMNSYDRYVSRLCEKYNLHNCIHFTGKLNAVEMIEQYLNANVFVCASSIENSPNSIGEAMILGCPVIAADVGGMKDLISHGVDGYIYPWDETYMLSYYIKTIFCDSQKAKRISENAIKKASSIHDFQKNTNQLLSIYENIIKGGGNETD